MCTTDGSTLSISVEVVCTFLHFFVLFYFVFLFFSIHHYWEMCGTDTWKCRSIGAHEHIKIIFFRWLATDAYTYRDRDDETSTWKHAGVLHVWIDKSGTVYFLGGTVGLAKSLHPSSPRGGVVAGPLGRKSPRTRNR